MVQPTRLDHKQALSEEIAHLTRKYLERGGAVEVLPPEEVKGTGQYVQDLYGNGKGPHKYLGVPGCYVATALAGLGD